MTALDTSDYVQIVSSVAAFFAAISYEGLRRRQSRSAARLKLKSQLVGLRNALQAVPAKPDVGQSAMSEDLAAAIRLWTIRPVLEWGAETPLIDNPNATFAVGNMVQLLGSNTRDAYSEYIGAVESGTIHHRETLLRMRRLLHNDLTAAIGHLG